MDDLLQCPICYINYNHHDKTPRQLDCQHILCSQCLPHMIKEHSKPTQHVECPLCKTKTNKQLSLVPKSLLIIQLIDATKSTNSSETTPISSAPPRPPAYRPEPPHLPPYPTMDQLPSYFRQTPSPPQFTKNIEPTKPVEVWDTTKFLRDIFNQIDYDHDGSITAIELQEALRRGQGSDFSLKTVELMISKYDKNSDRQISFEEFNDLYMNLNVEYENFLLTDSDGSGLIDTDEFSATMNKKGFYFNKKFFKFIVDEISKHTGNYGIQFDNYIR